MLFEAVKRYKVNFLDYQITSNHVHLLVYKSPKSDIAKGLQYADGRIGQKFNIDRKRHGSFWSGRYYATRIQNGTHLRHCLLYIDLNMVRAGVVKTPFEWEYSAFDDFYGQKHRYKIINIRKLLECLEFDDINIFRDWHKRNIDEILIKEKKENLERRKIWTTAAAIGDKSWLEENAETTGLKQYHIKPAGNQYFLEGINKN